MVFNTIIIPKLCRYYDIETEKGLERLTVTLSITTVFMTVMGIIIYGIRYNDERIEARDTQWSPVDSGALWIVVSSSFLLLTMFYVLIRSRRGRLTADDRAVLYIQLVMSICIIVYCERNEGWHTHHIMMITPLFGTLLDVNGWLVFSSCIVICICETVILCARQYFASFLRFTVPHNAVIGSLQYIVSCTVCALVPLMFVHWLRRERKKRQSSTEFITEIVELLCSNDMDAATRKIENVEAETGLAAKDAIVAAARKLLTHYTTIRSFLPPAAMVINDEGEFMDDENEEDDAANEDDEALGDAGIVEKSNFKKRWSTILHVCVTNLPSDSREADLISTRVSDAVISRVRQNRGVVDSLAPNSIIATFNCHVPCVLHTTEAANTALSIAGALSQYADLQFCIVVASGYNWIGSCGNDEQRAKVVVGESMDLIMRIPSLAFNRLGCTIVMTEDTATKVNCEVVPIDVIAPKLHGRPSRNITLYELRSARKESAQAAFVAAYTNAFAAFRAGDYVNAAQMWRNQCERDTQARRLLIVCERMEALRKAALASAAAASVSDRNGVAVPAVPAVEPYVRQEINWEAMEGNFVEQLKVGNLGGTLTTEASTHFASVSQQEHDVVTHVRKQFKEKDNPGEYNEDGLFSMFVPEDNDDATAGSGVDNGGGAGGTGGTGGTGANGSGQHGASGISGDIASSIDSDVPRSFEDTAGTRWQRSDTMIGEGAFSKVYLSLGELGNLVAVKCFSLAQTRTNKDELVKELDTLINLRNDYIVGYVSCAITPHHFIILMEYVSGGSLQQLLQQFGPLPIGAAKRYFIDIVRGLQYLHDQGITHCDIKPHNCLLANDGTCKLSDFGSSVVGHQQMSGSSTNGETVTDYSNNTNGDNIVRGTSWYMAPECARGDIAPAIDIWSLGISLLEILTGRTGWSWNKGEAAFIVALGRDDSMVPTIPDSVRSDAADVIRSCCQRDPSKRPTTQQLMMKAFLNS